MGSALTHCTTGRSNGRPLMQDKDETYTPHEIEILRDIESLGVPPDILTGHTDDLTPTLEDLKCTARYNISLQARMHFPDQGESLGTALILFYTVDGIAKVIRCAGKQWQTLSAEINRIKNGAFNGHFSVVFEHTHLITADNGDPSARHHKDVRTYGTLNDDGDSLLSDNDADESTAVMLPSSTPWKQSGSSGWVPWWIAWPFYRSSSTSIVRHVVHFCISKNVYIMWAQSVKGLPGGPMQHAPFLFKKSNYTDPQNLSADMIDQMSMFSVDLREDTHLLYDPNPDSREKNGDRHPEKEKEKEDDGYDECSAADTWSEDAACGASSLSSVPFHREYGSEYGDHSAPSTSSIMEAVEVSTQALLDGETPHRLFDIVVCARGHPWSTKCSVEVIPYQRMERKFLKQAATVYELHPCADVVDTTKKIAK